MIYCCASKDENKLIKLKRDHRTNPIYHCFDVDSYERTIAPNNFFEISVKYMCTIPHQKNRDYFSVYTDGHLSYNITLKAESLGK